MLDRRLLDEGFMSKDLNKFETQGAAVMIQASRKALTEICTGAVDIDFRGDKKKANISKAQVKMLSFMDELISGIKKFESKESITMMKYIRRQI